MDMIMMMIMMICLGTDLVPSLVFLDKLLLRYVYICRYSPILYNNIIDCHGNHAILHNLNILLFKDIHFCTQMVSLNKSARIRNHRSSM